MKLGLALRTMGEASRPSVLLECARTADQAGIDDFWVQDHIAIPPDDAEGSGGRYLDPLTTLAWLGAATERIGLGTGVLVAPYRPPLPTAKAIATVQELCGGRMRLGVGVGWMASEFRAVGADRGQRGAETDRLLEFLDRCFRAKDDVVEENGQAFLFRPNPAPPPIFIGGASPQTFQRVVRYAQGWMPMGADPAKLGPAIEKLHALASEAGRPAPEVAAMGGLPENDPAAGADRLAALAEIGVTRFIAGGRYTEASEFRAQVEALCDVRSRLA